MTSKAPNDSKHQIRPFRLFLCHLSTFGLGGATRPASHMTEVLVANQHQENVNKTRPPIGQDLQTANALPYDLK